MTTEVHCPKCNSNQITANKKGFSGGKALAGAVLTGGVGFLAGTIGSGKVNITCLACGNVFKPGEGKVVEIIDGKEINDENILNEAPGEIEKIALTICQSKGKLAAIKYYKETKNISLQIAKKFIDKLAADHGITKKTEGCFVATACYGDYNAHEVIILRKYRDENLLTNSWGKFFVMIYYRVSPTFSKLIYRSTYLKKIIKAHFLFHLINYISKK